MLSTAMDVRRGASLSQWCRSDVACGVVEALANLLGVVVMAEYAIMLDASLLYDGLI